MWKFMSSSLVTMMIIIIPCLCWLLSILTTSWQVFHYCITTFWRTVRMLITENIEEILWICVVVNDVTKNHNYHAFSIVCWYFCPQTLIALFCWLLYHHFSLLLCYYLLSLCFYMLWWRWWNYCRWWWMMSN